MATEFDPRETVQAALTAERPVRFYYLRPGYVPMQRTVSPYEISDDGATFLGYDHSRDALRRFDFGLLADIEVAENEDYVYPINKED